MRIIKFRGKDNETGEWLYGHFFQRMGCYPAIVEPRRRDGKVIYYEIAVEDTTVGQFTGLHDKNGREIYEGDLLELDEVPKIFNEVYWNCSMSAFCLAVHTITEGVDYGTTPLGDVLNKFKSLHIVGNIYDNPELLKGGEE